MYRYLRPPHLRRPAAVLVILVATLALGACDHDIEITAPEFPGPTSTPVTSADRTLEISVTLTALEGSCVEATLFYDGVELAEAHRTCAEGCARLELSALTPRTAGEHTLEVRVLRQSRDAVDYRVAGEALIIGSTPRLSIPLGPTQETLRAGESVSYPLRFDVALWP